MNRADRPIFRVEAIRRYTESREKTVLPRLITPRVMVSLWVLVALLVIAVIASWFARLPMYTSGSAVAVPLEDYAALVVDEEVALVLLLPPAALQSLEIGKAVFIQSPNSEERWRTQIVAVEPEIASPDALYRRFAINENIARYITQYVTGPVAVAIAPLEPSWAGLDASGYTGAIFGIDVEVGSIRIISLLPFMENIR